MKDWEKKEISDANLFKGKRTPKSGGFWSFAGDIISKDFLIDSKTTEKNRFSVTKQIWEKVEVEALKSRKIPILSAKFGNSNIEIVILSKEDFIELLVNKKKEVKLNK